MKNYIYLILIFVPFIIFGCGNEDTVNDVPKVDTKKEMTVYNEKKVSVEAVPKKEIIVPQKVYFLMQSAKIFEKPDENSEALFNVKEIVQPLLITSVTEEWAKVNMKELLGSKAAVKVSKANLFSKPTKSGTRLSEVSEGEKVDVIKQETDWCRVTTDNYVGWILNKNLTFPEEEGGWIKKSLLVSKEAILAKKKALEEALFAKMKALEEDNKLQDEKNARALEQKLEKMRSETLVVKGFYIGMPMRDALLLFKKLYPQLGDLPNMSINDVQWVTKSDPIILGFFGDIVGDKVKAAIDFPKYKFSAQQLSKYLKKDSENNLRLASPYGTFGGVSTIRLSGNNSVGTIEISVKVL